MNLSEPTQPQNQTQFEQAANSVIHTGSGDVNILVPNVEGIISFIKQIIPSDQIGIIENLTKALRRLSLCQKLVSELKSVHNMLHELEIALATIESPIRTSIRQNEILSIYGIEDMWQLSVLPRIRHMKKFASEEMRLLEPRFGTDGGMMVGPAWLLDLIILQEEFEASLGEKNPRVIYNASRSILDMCREHLLRIDRQLLDAVNKLEQVSDQILRGIDNA